MSIADIVFENHYDGTCNPEFCPCCRLERGEINAQEFEDIIEGE